MSNWLLKEEKLKYIFLPVVKEKNVRLAGFWFLNQKPLVFYSLYSEELDVPHGEENRISALCIFSSKDNKGLQIN